MKDLAYKLKKYFGIMLYMQKIDIMNRMAYRINFAVQVLTVGLQMIFSLVFIGVLFASNKSVAGWNFYEVLLVVGTYMIVEGVMWGFCAYLSALNKNIREGTLDGILLRPMDTQFLISVWRGDVEDFTRVISGIGVVVFALRHIELADSLLPNLFLYVIMVICAIVITYSLNVFLRSITFWTIEGEALFSVSMALTRITQYPNDIFYNKAVRFATTFIVPLAFMATVPARILAHGFELRLVALSILLAAVFFLFSRRFFYFALKHYESGSN